MIQSHLYARNTETNVFGSPVDSLSPAYKIHEGNWLGVIDRIEGWIKVIGINVEGWVKEGDVEERAPFQLHALWIPGKPIEYVSEKVKGKR